MRLADLYLLVFFLSLDLFAFAAFTCMSGFAISSQFGHAAAGLTCATVVPEAFFTFPAPSDSFLTALLCSFSVCVTNPW